MSAELAHLDNLSNKDLLKKCKELGLPEVPVTDSTRNVIIRRLRSAISGIPLNKSKSAGKKTAPRRETVHGSQVSTPTAEPVRRAAGRSNTTKISETSRRTIAYGLDNTSLSGRSVQTTTTVSDVGSQSEDDDYFMVDSPRVGYSHATQTPPKDDRSLKRSVSLTKSGVLTTSYTREVDQPHYEQDHQENDIPNSYTYERPHVPAAPRHTLPTYEPRIEPSSYKRSELGFSRPLLTQTQLNSTSYQESEHNPSRSPILPRNTFSGSAGPFGHTAPAPALPRQRQTAGFVRGSLIQPKTTLNTLYPQLNQFYDQPDNAEQPMEIDSESEEEEEVSPIKSSQVSRPRFSPTARPQVRRPLVRAQDQVSPMAQFRQLLVSLDQRYHIKLYFYVILVAMLASLIYVIVTPNA
ncbi:LEM domain-containing protein Bocksbeutel [Drosophila kikkawai]|uniref:LEM domain-containing protein Bocksbeutel n=1 Tax=Drosophila kikkawai TaxID=30033 RepID=A0A6P4HVS4_DROKI|nr:LEM domain-containing protein Bocksbeutel [Drosophila kikkawai]